MNVAVIGNGGREHAPCWKLTRSPRLTKLFCVPGNPGTAAHAENVAIDVTNGGAGFRTLIDWCKTEAIGLGTGRGVAIAYRTQDALDLAVKQKQRATGNDTNIVA